MQILLFLGTTKVAGRPQIFTHSFTEVHMYFGMVDSQVAEFLHTLSDGILRGSHGLLGTF